MLPIVAQVAKEYKEGLLQVYGDELVELILFGSHARGDFHDESDIDFAVVLRDPKKRAIEYIEKDTTIGSRLSLKYGLMVSTFRTSIEKKRTSMQGVYQEIRKDGIIIT